MHKIKRGCCKAWDRPSPDPRGVACSVSSPHNFIDGGNINLAATKLPPSVLRLRLPQFAFCSSSLLNP